MKLYAEYIKEREGLSLIEKDYGFCTYVVVNDYIYIVDIYIKKDKRNKRLAEDLTNEVIELGRELDCKYVMGSFCLDTKNWKVGKAFVKSQGFKYLNKDKKNNMIFVSKEI